MRETNLKWTSSLSCYNKTGTRLLQGTDVNFYSLHNFHWSCQLSLFSISQTSAVWRMASAQNGIISSSSPPVFFVLSDHLSLGSKSFPFYIFFSDTSATHVLPVVKHASHVTYRKLRPRRHLRNVYFKKKNFSQSDFLL